MVTANPVVIALQQIQVTFEGVTRWTSIDLFS